MKERKTYCITIFTEKEEDSFIEKFESDLNKFLRDANYIMLPDAKVERWQ